MSHVALWTTEAACGEEQPREQDTAVAAAGRHTAKCGVIATSKWGGGNGGSVRSPRCLRLDLDAVGSAVSACCLLSRSRRGSSHHEFSTIRSQPQSSGWRETKLETKACSCS